MRDYDGALFEICLKLCDVHNYPQYMSTIRKVALFRIVCGCVAGSPEIYQT